MMWWNKPCAGTLRRGYFCGCFLLSLAALKHTTQLLPLTLFTLLFQCISWLCNRPTAESNTTTAECAVKYQRSNPNRFGAGFLYPGPPGDDCLDLQPTQPFGEFWEEAWSKSSINTLHSFPVVSNCFISWSTPSLFRHSASLPYLVQPNHLPCDISCFDVSCYIGPSSSWPLCCVASY